METSQTFFQAIGIIRGNVTLASELGQKSTVSIQGKSYTLYPVPRRRYNVAVTRGKLNRLV